MSTPFKMKGSPHKLGAIEGTSAFKKKRPIDKSSGFDLDYTTDVSVKNRKLIKNMEKKYKAGKITKKQLEKEIREIKSYEDV
tara:strand:+ start:294 stop:539 length:246 start_codon:yes stop_codon:yes gene_type:complete